MAFTGKISDPRTPSGIVAGGSTAATGAAGVAASAANLAQALSAIARTGLTPGQALPAKKQANEDFTLGLVSQFEEDAQATVLKQLDSLKGVEAGFQQGRTPATMLSMERRKVRNRVMSTLTERGFSENEAAQLYVDARKRLSFDDDPEVSLIEARQSELDAFETIQDNQYIRMVDSGLVAPPRSAETYKQDRSKALEDASARVQIANRARSIGLRADPNDPNTMPREPFIKFMGTAVPDQLDKFSDQLEMSRIRVLSAVQEETSPEAIQNAISDYTELRENYRTMLAQDAAALNLNESEREQYTKVVDSFFSVYDLSSLGQGTSFTDVAATARKVATGNVLSTVEGVEFFSSWVELFGEAGAQNLLATMGSKQRGALQAKLGTTLNALLSYGVEKPLPDPGPGGGAPGEGDAFYGEGQKEVVVASKEYLSSFKSGEFHKNQVVLTGDLNATDPGVMPDDSGFNMVQKSILSVTNGRAVGNLMSESDRIGVDKDLTNPSVISAILHDDSPQGRVTAATRATSYLDKRLTGEFDTLINDGRYGQDFIVLVGISDNEKARLAQPLQKFGKRNILTEKRGTEVLQYGDITVVVPTRRVGPLTLQSSVSIRQAFGEKFQRLGDMVAALKKYRKFAAPNVFSGADVSGMSDEDFGLFLHTRLVTREIEEGALQDSLTGGSNAE